MSDLFLCKTGKKTNKGFIDLAYNNEHFPWSERIF